MVSFQSADVTYSLRHRKVIKKVLEEISLKEGREFEALNYIFCSDEYLLNLNQRFLKHNTYTDIITFDLSTGPTVISEIYISVDRVNENSRSHLTKVDVEMRRVIFHGALHLCGYKDKKKSEITVMRQKEEEYLSLFDSYLNH